MTDYSLFLTKINLDVLRLIIYNFNNEQVQFMHQIKQYTQKKKKKKKKKITKTKQKKIDLIRFNITGQDKNFESYKNHLKESFLLF